MKKKLLVFMAIAAIISFAFVIAACDEDKSDSGSDTTFVAVTDITGVKLSYNLDGEIPSALSGTVVPATATNKTISWSLKTDGTTAPGAVVNGGQINATGTGNVVVTATIVNGLTKSSNFTKDFTINIFDEDSFVAVTDITGVPTSFNEDQLPVALSGTVVPDEASNKIIVWSLKTEGINTAGATVEGGQLDATGTGTVEVTATIVNGLTATTNFTRNFTIEINPAGSYVPVSDITGVTITYDLAQLPATLSGTVVPGGATNSTIVWSLKTAGTNTAGATVTSAGLLDATGGGEVEVTATIVNGLTASTNFTKDFEITITDNGSVPGERIIELGAPQHYENDGGGYRWGAPDDAATQEWVKAKYFVQTLASTPLNNYSLGVIYGGMVGGTAHWYNPKFGIAHSDAGGSYRAPGVTWKEDEKELWYEISEVFGNPNFFPTIYFQLAFKIIWWQTGNDGAVISNQGEDIEWGDGLGDGNQSRGYIQNAWLVVE